MSDSYHSFKSLYSTFSDNNIYMKPSLTNIMWTRYIRVYIPLFYFHLIFHVLNSYLISHHLQSRLYLTVFLWRCRDFIHTLKVWGLLLFFFDSWIVVIFLFPHAGWLKLISKNSIVCCILSSLNCPTSF